MYAVVIAQCITFVLYEYPILPIYLTALLIFEAVMYISSFVNFKFILRMSYDVTYNSYLL